jgi:N-acetylmuramoyl-L-alanine amidase
MLAEIGKVNRLHGNRVEYAGFAVLKSPAVPSILVETAFLSNPEEERRLRDKKFQNKIAVAMANALQKYQQQYHTK